MVSLRLILTVSFVVVFSSFGLSEPRFDVVTGTYNGVIYILGTKSLTWVEAVMRCSEVGMIITDCNTKEEHDFLVNLIDRSGGAEVWVGASALGGDSAFKWAKWLYTKDPFDSSYWLPGEPSGSCNENCVLLESHNNGAEYNFRDHNCDEAFYWICKEPDRSSSERTRYFNSTMFNIRK